MTLLLHLGGLDEPQQWADALIAIDEAFPGVVIYKELTARFGHAVSILWHNLRGVCQWFFCPAVRFAKDCHGGCENKLWPSASMSASLKHVSRAIEVHAKSHVKVLLCLPTHDSSKMEDGQRTRPLQESLANLRLCDVAADALHPRLRVHTCCWILGRDQIEKLDALDGCLVVVSVLQSILLEKVST
eukprot:CAMPEP_0178395264 /NCGR_PEP_ID=MMETSP0689_2-20121128/13129_1 /TAXON_ID=160604 /ORGANISM="Amphidinium massartii, Strain CS-259" /LENGTH=186 /DNA_ID=CAMNT_0020015913 /DNA_START=422 /DNA_END=983 /DNA_ORIENTATION=+